MTLINKRNIVTCVLLSIFTLGIYGIYWNYLLVKNVRILKNDSDSCAGEMLCLLFVPFYSLYWWYTRGELVKTKFDEKGQRAISGGAIYLALDLFGFSIVNMCLMQNDFNGYDEKAKGSYNTKERERSVISTNASTEALLERAFIFLEDGDFQAADDYAEAVLDMAPKCAEAYLVKLMVENKIKTKEELVECEASFDESPNYAKALRFGDKTFCHNLKEYAKGRNNRSEAQRQEKIYREASDMMESIDEGDFVYAAQLFEKILGYKDSTELRELCFVRADELKKSRIYHEAKALMKDAEEYNIPSDYTSAIVLLEELGDYYDAPNLIEKCKAEIEQLKIKAEKKAKRNKKTMICVTIIMGIAIISFTLAKYLIVPTVKYNDAIVLMDAGDIVEAYEALVALDGYKDSEDKADSIYDKYKLKVAKVGDYINFGTYEQDNNTSNGKEDVEWLVLEKTADKMFVISKYALDCKPYNTSFTDITWETCTLRKWLNNDFINSAFSDNEKAMIPTVTVEAHKNPGYKTNPGNSTQDQVFLLSISEVNKYFSSDSARQCKLTDFAVADGGHVNSDNGNCWWWLRSPGNTQSYASDVNYDGSVRDFGFSVRYGNYGVRPVLWINLE